jgi:AraC-like DNA-binding protein
LLNTNFSSSNAVVSHLLNTNFTSTNAIITNVANTNLTSSNALITASSIGNVYVYSTENASAASAGGALTVFGGASIAKSLYVNTRNVTPSLGDIAVETAATAGNNISAAADLIGLEFDSTIVRSFRAHVSVSIDATAGNLYANYDLKGIQKASGWVVNSSFVGDNTGMVFSITPSGSIQYTSSNIPSHTATMVKYRASTTSV